jgi:hypothetical protein
MATPAASGIIRITVSDWVRATALGWLLGIPCVCMLALLGENLGIGGSQALVGAGMGIGVGAIQSRALRAIVPRPSAWFWSCTVGLALPFLGSDVLRLAGRSSTHLLVPSVALGGALVGLWQAFLLRSVLRRVGLWIAVSTVGWSLAAAAAGAADTLYRAHTIVGLAGALSYLGLIAVGGLLLGVITAPVAARIGAVDSAAT